jgi:hypothetical protein
MIPSVILSDYLIRIILVYLEKYILALTKNTPSKHRLNVLFFIYINFYNFVILNK